MSQRYQAGIILPGYNALKVANAPTIGTATSASATSVSVAFTAPSCVGGGAISSYTAYANCGIKLTSGASSPLVVTGLTTGTSYTFKVIATNVYGPSFPSAASNSATPLAIGQDAYVTAGTFSWVAPTGVTSVSVVSVGGGAAGRFNNDRCSAAGGAGGALAYANNISVTPGNSYTVVVGVGGVYGCGSGPFVGGDSSFNSTSVKAGGGTPASPSPSTCNGYAIGGAVIYGTGGAGGNGGRCGSRGFVPGSPGAGGAGGYSGSGGNGGYSSNGSVGSGGGGGGGGSGDSTTRGGAGGGVGILGAGADGAGGTTGSGQVAVRGGGGSGGTGGCRAADGGPYGGGGAYGFGRCAASGAVRIIWPGTTRSFPSTNTGNL